MNGNYLYRAKSITGETVTGLLSAIPVKDLPEQLDLNFVHSIMPDYKLLHRIIVEKGGIFTTHPIDPDTIRRCTGIRDKNGDLIFDGDEIILTAKERQNYYTDSPEPYLTKIVTKTHRSFVSWVKGGWHYLDWQNFYRLLGELEAHEILIVPKESEKC